VAALGSLAADELQHSAAAGDFAAVEVVDSAAVVVADSAEVAAAAAAGVARTSS
jgi:hypothetical protein